MLYYKIYNNYKSEAAGYLKKERNNIQKLSQLYFQAKITLICFIDEVRSSSIT